MQRHSTSAALRSKSHLWYRSSRRTVERWLCVCVHVVAVKFWLCRPQKEFYSLLRWWLKACLGTRWCNWYLFINLNKIPLAKSIQNINQRYQSLERLCVQTERCDCWFFQLLRELALVRHAIAFNAMTWINLDSIPNFWQSYCKMISYTSVHSRSVSSSLVKHSWRWWGNNHAYIPNLAAEHIKTACMNLENPYNYCWCELRARDACSM